MRCLYVVVYFLGPLSPKKGVGIQRFVTTLIINIDGIEFYSHRDQPKLTISIDISYSQA